MNYLDEAERARRLTDNLPRLYEGTIVATPELGEGMEVVLPGYDPDTAYGPMPYSPRLDAIPMRGMSCLVAISSDEEFWCVQWWPGSLADAEVSSGIRSGHGSPSAGLGRDNDFYLDIDTEDLYGPKIGLSWGSPTNLKGTQGDPGPAGVNGIEGISGAQGPAGPAGPTGPVGNPVVAWAQHFSPVSLVAISEPASTVIVTAPNFVADGATDYWYEYNSPYATPDTPAGSYFYFCFFDGSTSLGFAHLQMQPAAGVNSYNSVGIRQPHRPAAGTRSISLRGFTVAGAAGIAGAGPGGAGQYEPGTIAITRIQT